MKPTNSTAASLAKRASLVVAAATVTVGIFMAGPAMAQEQPGGGFTGTQGDLCSGDSCGEEIIRLGEGLGFYAVLMCIAGIFISASLWAVGSKGQNPGTELAGKRGMIVCLTAAFLLGALPAWIGFLSENVANSVQQEVNTSR